MHAWWSIPVVHSIYWIRVNRLIIFLNSAWSNFSVYSSSPSGRYYFLRWHYKQSLCKEIAFDLFVLNSKVKKDFRVFFTNFLEWSFSPITHVPSISLKCFLQSCEKDFISSFHIPPTSSGLIFYSFTIYLSEISFFHFLHGLEMTSIFWRPYYTSNLPLYSAI